METGKQEEQFKAGQVWVGPGNRIRRITTIEEARVEYTIDGIKNTAYQTRDTPEVWRNVGYVLLTPDAPETDRLTALEERIEALNAARTQELVRVGPLEGTTPEKWAQTVEQFAYISKAHGDADPQFWAVAIESPEHDGDVVTAMTGNGPTSKANAEFYAACHWAVPALLGHIDEQGAEIERLREAVEACLLFHDSGSWDMEKRLSWQRLTRQSEATTRALCDTLRAALKEVQGDAL